MIIPCIALAISIATLAYVLYNGHKIRKTRQEAEAHLGVALLRGRKR